MGSSQTVGGVQSSTQPLTSPLLQVQAAQREYFDDVYVVSSVVQTTVDDVHFGEWYSTIDFN